MSDYGSMNTMETTTSSSQPISNLVVPPHIIVLDVSGRKYRTQKVTLQTSPYFQNFFARWDDYSDRRDGSYFIDADPDVFEHVLQFMRRPSKFPLFWTRETSFDYVLYNKLEAEADYFLLHDLRDWIKKKHYLNAIKMIMEIKVLSENEIRDWHTQRNYNADIEVQTFHGGYSGWKQCRNFCPTHKDRDYVLSCHDCRASMQVFGTHFDDPAKKLTIVTKRIVFDETVCVNGTGS